MPSGMERAVVPDGRRVFGNARPGVGAGETRGLWHCPGRDSAAEAESLKLASDQQAASGLVTKRSQS